MMANYRVFVIAFSALVCNNISLVQCNDECKSNADCKDNYFGSYDHCCGGLYFGSFHSASDTQRRCTYGSCLHHYCSSDSDCGDSSMCCRSNECVKKGCSGCTKNTDCDTSESHVCCRKTFPLNQTVCAANCINEDCNSNDDCAGNGECCRSGKCTSKGCSDKCKSNSECNSDQSCCKKAQTSYWRKTGCSQTCVGKLCSTNEDCGAANECCISNKCVDQGCSGCTTNSNCSTGQYCCKKRQWYELSECSADCIGKSCGTSDDCGGPGETCDSDHRCTNKPMKTPSWLVAVITVSLVVFLIAVGVLLAVFWHIKSKRAASANQTGTVPLLNTQYRGVQPPQPNSQFSGVTNPTYHETIGQNQPGQMPQTNEVAHQSPNSTYYPQKFQNGAQNQLHNPLHNIAYQPLESPSAPQDTSIGQQMYPQTTHYNPLHNTAYQHLESPSAPQDTSNTPYQGNNYLHNPPAYNPFHGNH